MRDFIQELLDYLVNEGVLLGAEGKDIIPDEPDRATAIYELQPSYTSPITKAQVRNFQLQTRGATYIESLNDAWNMYEKLNNPTGEAEITISGTPYVIKLRSTPYKLKTDTLQRTYFFFNFSVSVPI